MSPMYQAYNYLCYVQLADPRTFCPSGEKDCALVSQLPIMFEVDICYTVHCNKNAQLGVCNIEYN